MKPFPFSKIFLGFAGLLLVGMASGEVFAKSAAEPIPDDDRKLEIVYEMYAGYRKDFPGIEEIDPDEAMRLWREGRTVFVDTRTPEEMAVSMLPDAVSKEDYLSDPDRFGDRTVVAYCTISYRSGLFAKEMAEKDRRVLNLRGGMLAWALEDGPIFDETGETRRMHVYGKKWDLAPAEYETVRFGKFEQFLKSMD